MVACDATIQSLAFEIESSWAEDVDTMTHGVQLCAPVEFGGITHEMLAPERVTARRLEGTKGIPGPFSNLTISFSCYLTGHGSATTGAVTVNSLATLIGYAIGASAAASSSGTTLTGGTVTVPTTTASGTFSAGALVPIGALGDTDGEGQHYLISTHTAQNLTLLNDLAGAPQNGAVLYNAGLAYAADSSCSLTGVRMRIQSADLQFILHGGFPTSFTITGLGPGEVPKVNFTWQFSWAEPVAGTFPTTPTADAFSPSPNAADGSYHLQTVATTTRALISPRAFSIDYQLAVMPVMGGNGVNAYQVITGARRGRDQIFVNLVVDGLGADATPLYWDEWLTNPYKYLVATLNSKATQRVGIALRNMVYAGARPSQTNNGGFNCIPLRFQALASGTTTSDLTLTPLQIALS
jgi:hypothetical protein